MNADKNTCGLNLLTTGLVIACLNIIKSIACFGFWVSHFDGFDGSKHIRDANLLMAAAAFADAVLLIASGVLIAGIVRRKHLFLLPWLIWFPFVSCYNAIIYGGLVLLSIASGEIAAGIAIIFLFLGVYVSSWIAVRILRLRFRRINKTITSYTITPTLSMN